MDARSKKGWKLSFSHDKKAIGVLIDIKESKRFPLVDGHLFIFGTILSPKDKVWLQTWL